jgi:glycosyltransferase involved in cell wall biosynthesis
VRIAYYTHPAFFEPALCLVRELSRHADVDLLLEVSRGAWQTASFDLGPRALPAGLVPADDVLRDAFPAGVRAYWRCASTFHLVVHPSPRSIAATSWTISRRALQFAVERRADVLHIDDVDVSPRLALALPGFRGLPIVIAVHDPQPHSGERNWRKALARRLAYPRARRFVVYNRAQRLAFAAAHGIDPSAVGVARLGVYDVFTQWPSEPINSRPAVLFFGRLSVYKGLDVFYDAVRLIARRVAGVRVVVAGKPVPGYIPPVPPALEQEGSIEVLDDYLTNSDAARLFREALVVVCPYRDATQSGVVLTAFAFGVPVVATAVGGLPEYVVPGRTGLLVPPGDVEALADAICRVLEDRALAARLGAGIVSAAADEMHWRHPVATLMRTYRDLIGPT